ncbi:MAG: hypothetical protein VKO39_08090 [Cyanobacteriota bacterium]|nr:hypothetical protein [Cyanobacteriota bacterium]
MPHFLRSIRSLLFPLAISTTPMLAAFPARAVFVTVNHFAYDVIVFAGSYDDHSAFFQMPPLGYMPWWGDPSGLLASEFARQVYDSLGSGSDADSGPIFAYQYDPNTASLDGWVQSITDPNVQDLKNTSSALTFNYAILNPAPVPGPLPVLAATAAFAMSRRLRRRARLNQAGDAGLACSKTGMHVPPRF